MEPIASFSGLASGVQWRDLVDQIMQVERRPIRLLEGRIDSLEDRSSAWLTFRGKVEQLETRAAALAGGSAFRVFQSAVSGYSGERPPLTAPADSDATEGSYGVAVHRLAAREKLGGSGFASRTEALGLSGEFLVNGTRIEVTADDDLDDVVDEVNRLRSESGITAALVSTSSGGYRMVLTADDAGAAGVDLVDGGDRLLRDLGFLDASSVLKHATSDGAESDAFTSRTTAVGTLSALATAPPSGAVSVAGEAVTIDLSVMSLDDVAQAINDQATASGKAFSAAVVGETDDEGVTRYRLDVSGTTAFADANGILEALGVVEGGRSAVARQVQSATAFTDASTGLAATGTTLFSDLEIGGVAAGVQAGDTLDVTGTRGDGSTFTASYTVQAGDTLADFNAFLAAGSDDFGSGATASVAVSAGGSLTLTDDTAGGSLLDLSIVANNEGGGTLDFGAFSVAAEGRARALSQGADALVEVDGTFVTSSSNAVTDAIPGLTLRLTEATGETVDVEVTRDTGSAVTAVKDFVDAYNDLQEWVDGQFSGAGADEGVANPPLSGDSTLRRMRDGLRAAMQSTVASGVAGSLTRLTHVGIEVDRHGVYQLDTGTLEAALEDDPEAVARLFGVHGEASVGELSYVSSSDASESGSYSVDVTSNATTADVTGSGFGSGLGSYQDDGTADTMVVTDLSTQSQYSVSLSSGDTMADIVDALNTQFGTATRRRLEASEVLHADAVGTTASEDTLLSDLHDSGGTGMGVAAGDTLTFSGTGSAGASFLVDHTVSDPATETVGTLLSRIRDAVGTGVDVSLQGGRVTLSETDTGRSSLTLSVSSDNAGGGTFGVGTVDVAEAGRSTAAITASDEAGELRLVHDLYGSVEGFEVAFQAGGGDGTASLGLAAGTYEGTDVVATVGGHATTGSGRVITGADDTPIEGLRMTWEGADTGTVGTLTFSRGLASRVALAAAPMLEADAGSITGVTEDLADRVTRLFDRIDDMELRLESEREALIRRFTAMEQAMAQAQAQSQWLTAQIGTLVAPPQQ